jgi:hypothetical protein
MAAAAAIADTKKKEEFFISFNAALPNFNTEDIHCYYSR